MTWGCKVYCLRVLHMYFLHLVHVYCVFLGPHTSECFFLLLLLTTAFDEISLKSHANSSIAQRNSWTNRHTYTASANRGQIFCICITYLLQALELVAQGKMRRHHPFPESSQWLQKPGFLGYLILSLRELYISLLSNKSFRQGLGTQAKLLMYRMVPTRWRVKCARKWVLASVSA